MAQTCNLSCSGSRVRTLIAISRAAWSTHQVPAQLGQPQEQMVIKEGWGYSCAVEPACSVPARERNEGRWGGLFRCHRLFKTLKRFLSKQTFVMLVTIRLLHAPLAKTLLFPSSLINELINNGWALSWLNWCETTQQGMWVGHVGLFADLLKINWES